MANSNNKYNVVLLWGARGSAVERALASQQCGPGSNSGVDATCGLSLLLVLSYAPKGFSPGTPVFPFPQKPSFPNSNSTSSQVDEEPVCGCATSKSLFIYLFVFNIPSVCILNRNPYDFSDSDSDFDEEEDDKKTKKKKKKKVSRRDGFGCCFRFFSRFLLILILEKSATSRSQR